MSYSEFLFSDECIKQKFYNLYNIDYLKKIKDKNARFIYLHYIFDNYHQNFEKISSTLKQQILQECCQEKYQRMIHQMINLQSPLDSTQRETDTQLNFLEISAERTFAFAFYDKNMDLNVKGKIKTHNRLYLQTHNEDFSFMENAAFVEYIISHLLDKQNIYGIYYLMLLEAVKIRQLLFGKFLA